MFKMYKFCIPYISKYKTYFLSYYFLVLICGGTGLIVPMLNGKIIDYITTSQRKLLFYNIKLFVLVNLCYIILSFVKNRIYIKIQTNAAFQIFSDLIYHFQKLPISKIQEMDIGAVNQKINEDSNSITTFIVNLMGDFTINLICIIFSLIILFQINIQIGSSVLLIGVAYLLIYLLFKKIIYIISFRLKEEQARFFSIMLMQLRNIKFVKIHSLILEYRKKMQKYYKQYYSNVMKAQNFFFVYSSLDSIITLIVNIFIFVIGGNMVMNQMLTIGEFTIIISYFNYIIASFKYFSSLVKECQENKVAYDRLKKFFDLEEQREGRTEISRIRKISCQNVTLVRNNKKIITGFNYIFIPGKIYCICGGNGKGKTTLLETILGIHRDEYEGEIFYNDINIKDINMYKLRYSHISVMEQHLELLEGNIEDNICLSAHHTINNICSSMKMSNEEIQKEFKRFHKINNDGSGVSGGEGQKLGIFRVLAKDSEVFFLDEPTASLDQKGIGELMELLNKIKNEKIIVIISHDVETIKFCDCVINL